MATGLSSPLGVAGIILIIIGIIMAVIGIILLIAHQNRDRPWYIWFLLITGVVMGIIGGILLAVALSQVPTTIAVTRPVIDPLAPTYMVAPSQPQYVVSHSPTHVGIPAPPTRIVGTHTELVGNETFDPDPQSIVTESPPVRVRRTATGPYGPGGSQATVTGVYKGPAVRTYTSHDIDEHEVVSSHPIVSQPGVRYQ